MIKEFAVISRKNRKKITKFASGGGEGAEVVYALRNNSNLAKKILDEIGKEGQVTNKYYQKRLPSDTNKDYYFIHRNTGNIQTVLIEYGFIDNEEDAERLKQNYEKYAEAVVRAVSEYKEIDYIPPEGETVYIVQKGDNLWDIADKFGITVDDLKKANNLVNNLLSIGQILKIPSTNQYVEYSVKRGDSLWSIANDFGTTVDEIKKENGLTNNLLNIGQILRIPIRTQ